MPDTDEQVLVNLGFPVHIAKVYVRARGLCEYCGADLFVNKVTYGAIQIDHIVPRANKGDDDHKNLALSCSSCNSLKSDWRPQGVEREAQLREVRAHIEQKSSEYNRIWKETDLLIKKLRVK